jgi:hypothetical protein
MTKLTNYLATVTDVNSVFSAKGAVIPNSERCVIKDDTGQTVGSVGAVNHWNIDTTADPLVTYTNPRLPRWQDLVPLDCNFTFSTTQLASAPAGLDPTYGVTIWFDASGSMDQVLPQLEAAVVLLRPCLLQYYNNDVALYNQRVKVISDASERTMVQLGTLPSTGATRNINLVFSNESESIYYNNGVETNIYVTPNVFLPTKPRVAQYTADIATANANLSDSVRGIIYRVNWPTSPPSLVNFNNVAYGFYQAVFKGQGNYAGQYGLAGNVFARLVDDVNYAGDSTYFKNLIVSGMNSIGFNITCP